MQTPKPMTLRRNFSWTFLGNAVYTGCQWGMLVVIAKLGSPEMVGQFTLGFAITAPVFMFTNLNLRSIQGTDAKQEFCFGDYLGLRLISTGLAILIVTGIIGFSHYTRETAIAVFLVGIAKAIESISDILYGLLQHHELMDRIAISMLIKGPLSLSLLGIGIYLSSDITWGIIGILVAWLLILVFYDIRSAAQVLNNSSLSFEAGNLSKKQGLDELKMQNLYPQWHLKTLVALARLVLPLGFAMMLVSLNTNIPRYFIEHYLGVRELGVFAAISYLMVAGSMIMQALGESATPRLAKYYANKKRKEFRNLLLQLIGLCALLGTIPFLIALVAGKQILAIIYQPEYAQYTDILVLITIAAGIGYVASFLGYGMTAARYLRVQMLSSCLVTATSAIVSMKLLPQIGLQGAAIALILSVAVRALIGFSVMVHALYKI